MKNTKNQKVKIEKGDTKVELPNETFWARVAIFAVFVGGIVFLGKDAMETNKQA